MVSPTDRYSKIKKCGKYLINLSSDTRFGMTIILYKIKEMLYLF